MFLSHFQGVLSRGEALRDILVSVYTHDSVSEVGSSNSFS